MSLEGGPTCVPVCDRVAMTRLSRISGVDWVEFASGRYERWLWFLWTVPGRTVECQLTEACIQDLVGLEYGPKLVYCWAVAIETWLSGGDHSLPSAFSSSLHLSDESWWGRTIPVSGCSELVGCLSSWVYPLLAVQDWVHTRAVEWSCMRVVPGRDLLTSPGNSLQSSPCARPCHFFVGNVGC